MKDRLLIALFSVGTVLGFGGGLFSLAFHHGHHAQRRQAAFENHIADVCVDAAQRAERPERVVVERVTRDRPDPRDRDWDQADWDRPQRGDRHERRRHRRHRRHRPHDR